MPPQRRSSSAKPIAEVTAEERRRQDGQFRHHLRHFGLRLSQRLEIPRKEAKELIDGYFASYPKVREYMERVVDEARRDGYVATIFGRRRYLNDIASRNAVARGLLAERNAVNRPIQGSAADIMKIAMIAVSHRASRPKDPLAGDPAGARRTGGRYAARGAGARRADRHREHGGRGPRSKVRLLADAASEPTGSRRIEGAGFFCPLTAATDGSPFRTLCRGYPTTGAHQPQRARWGCLPPSAVR